MAKPIKRVSLQSEIIRYIQSYIEEHDLKEGDRLPSQGQFIEMMQVSRTALREAVKTLEAEGIVEVLNGKGIYVGNRSRGSNAIESLIGFTREREALIEALEAEKGDGDRVDSYGSKECHRPGNGRARRDHRSPDEESTGGRAGYRGGQAVPRENLPDVSQQRLLCGIESAG